jgi:sugar lactone lactonase YvrE
MKTPFFFLSGLLLTAVYGQNSAPNPYRTVENWGQLPDGRKWGSTSAIDIDRDGHIWVAERCGANFCTDSKVAPIVEFDSSGKVLKSFGEGLFAQPHSLYIDAQGNIWVADDDGRGGKGQQVFKFSPEGKVLMTLGKQGVAGTDEATFNQPSAVIVAPDGSIFVADGHGGNSNARIVKFTKDGKFIKAWGKKGSGPGEFDTPHTLAFDSKGRLYVGDRGNSRIQIFDQDGKFLEQWTQFGRPSGVFIDKNDNIYVADSQSNSKQHPGWKRGIRVGSAKDGSVAAFIPDPEPNPDSAGSSSAEGIVADRDGNIYGAEVGSMSVKKYVKR